MKKKPILALALAAVTLAAGLGVASRLLAGGADKARPRDVAVRLAFAAPAITANHPAAASYQAELRDLTRGTTETVGPLSFTTVAGPVDSHVVWLVLDYYHSYEARVRGMGANGAAGLWSEWSELHENTSPWQNPDPPSD